MYRVHNGRARSFSSFREHAHKLLKGTTIDRTRGLDAQQSYLNYIKLRQLVQELDILG